MVQRDLGIDAAQMGIVFSTFFVGYALFNFIGGLASDRLGPKRVYVIAVGLWSIFCGMTAITIGFVSLLIVRLLFGMAEGRSARPRTRWSTTGCRANRRPRRWGC